MNYIGIKFPLPKPEAPVAKRELTVDINGRARTYTLPGSALFSDEFVFAETDTYSAKLVDIDQYGNRSLSSEALNGAAEEDLRPVKPGMIGPLVAANKRVLTAADAEKAKVDVAKKEAELAKIETDKAKQLAKADADRAAAHAKIDADAAAAKENLAKAGTSPGNVK